MSLQIWLPLNKDLHNQGVSRTKILSCDATLSEYAYLFSSGNALITDRIVPICDNTQTFSISFWMKPTQTSTDYNIVGSKRYSWVIYASGGNIAFLQWNQSGGTGLYLIGSAGIAVNKWTHIVVTWDGYTLKLYVDGVQIGTTSQTITPSQHQDVNNTSYDYRLRIGGDIWRNNRVDYEGSIYDFRVYDHALSTKEITEISKGCILHYPCNDILNERTVNLTPYPTPGSAVGAIGWDQSKHQGAISVDNSWSVGYNGGVQLQSAGYHACWKLIDKHPTIVFVDKNTSIGYPHRWLGVSNYNSALINGITSNTTYTVSFEAKSDDANMSIQSGLYYKQTSSGSTSFYDGQVKINITNQWQKYSYTKTTGTVYSISGFYIYGHYNTSEGTSYVRNVQVEIKDHATVYTPSSRSGNYLKDVSGFGNHSTITGSLPLSTTPKSARYDKCMDIDNSGTNKNYANCTINAPQVKSASFWVYIGASIPNTQQVLFVDYTSKIGFGFSGSDKIICGTVEPNETCYAGFYPTNSIKYNNWNHIVTNQLTETSCQLFLNGAQIQPSGNDNWYNNVNGFYFARRAYGAGSYYTGQVSDFRLFTRALTQADVDDLYKDSFAIDKNQNGFTYELNENDSYSTVEVKKNGQLLCSDYEESQLLMIKMYWNDVDEKFELDYEDYYAYEGKTTTWEGQKCYIWQRYDAGCEAYDYEDTDNSENIILTNTLNIKMPFNGSSPEFVAAIGLDGVECYDEPRLAMWAYVDSGGEYTGMIKLEGADSSEVARMCKSGKVTTREIHEI